MTFIVSLYITPSVCSFHMTSIFVYRWILLVNTIAHPSKDSLQYRRLFVAQFGRQVTADPRLRPNLQQRETMRPRKTLRLLTNPHAHAHNIGCRISEGVRVSTVHKLFPRWTISLIDRLIMGGDVIEKLLTSIGLVENRTGRAQRVDAHNWRRRISRKSIYARKF